jgi:hypothetical protein
MNKLKYIFIRYFDACRVHLLLFFYYKQLMQIIS